MSSNKLKQFALALKALTQRDRIEDVLLDLGLSSQDFENILDAIMGEQHHELITYEQNSTVSGRVFSPWEKLFLSLDAQRFLLSALYTDVITPLELEQALAILGVQTPGFAGIEEVCTTLEDVVQDDHRMAILMDARLEYIH